MKYQTSWTQFAKVLNGNCEFKQEAQRATVAHLSTMNVSKIWQQNGTKNNKASSHMLQDHGYAFSLLL